MSSLRRHFPRFYRFAALLAILGVLAPMLVGFVHHQASSSAWMHLCGVEQQSDNTQKAPSHKPVCPICFSLHLLGNGFVPTALVLIIALMSVVSDVRPRWDILLVHIKLPPQARPRAPPLFA